jgi:hypothetical protein
MAPIQIDFRTQESAIATPANRFGIIGRLLRTIFRIKAPQTVEGAKQVPIEIQLKENGEPVELGDLQFRTGKRPYNIGVCNFEVAYTKENGLTCLYFVVYVTHEEIGGRFSQVILNNRVPDLGK